MKWLLIVVAVNAAEAPGYVPGDAVRSSMAARVHATFTEWSLTRDVSDGVAYATRTDCRAAARALEARGPDAEREPAGPARYKGFCKPIQGRTES